jgi:outer membrane protein assembly factor BamA
MMRQLTGSSSNVLLVVFMALLAPALRAQSAPMHSSSRETRNEQTRSTSLRVLPVIGSAPETGFLGGATAIRVSTLAGDTVTRASTEQVYAAYTAKHQFRAFASTDRWSSGNRWGVSAQLEYQRFPQPFYGIGIDAPKNAEEWYEARSLIASAIGRRKLARAAYAQLGLRFSNTMIRDADEGGVIESGDVVGARGGIVSQVIGGAAWDSRDNVFAPAAGTFAQATAAYSGRELAADYRFARYTADARRYRRLGRGVLAGQAYVEATSGSAPFDQLSLVGSSSVMRGYVRGRFRDRDLASAQLEYRTPVVGRFGVAAFAGAGTVAPTFSKLASTTVLPSYGVGARWLLLPKQGTTVRVDYGVGRSASGLYIAFNEAF